MLIGLIAPMIVFALYYLINYRFMSISGFFNYLRLGGTYTPLVSLCVLVNLGCFYPFIWKEKWNGARGVLTATFLWAGFVVYLKFFT